jgi:hypothetical protein
MCQLSLLDKRQWLNALARASQLDSRAAVQKKGRVMPDSNQPLNYFDD